MILVYKNPKQIVEVQLSLTIDKFSGSIENPDSFGCGVEVVNNVFVTLWGTMEEEFHIINQQV